VNRLQLTPLLSVNRMQSVPVLRRKEVERGAMSSGCKANTKTVIRLVNEALATEITGILRYKRHYFMTAGMSSRQVKAEFCSM